MFKITKDHEQAIKTICKIAPQKNAMQSLENILIKSDDFLSMTSGDGVIEITSILDCEVSKKGSFIVNANRFLSVLNACSFDCEVIEKQDFIQIKSGRKRFKLSVLPADNYPDYPEISDKKEITSNAISLIDLMQKAMIAASSNDVRYQLNGVFIGSDVVATDGHRLVRFAESYDCAAIVPVEAIKKIPLIDGKVYASGSMIQISNTSTTVKSKLIDGKYVQYERAIGVPSLSALIEVSDLVDAVKSSMITLTNVNSTILIKSAGGVCSISSKGSKSDESNIEIKAEGDDFSFSCNGRYLLDALSFYDGQISIGVNESQMIIESDNITNIVMAVRS